MSRYGNWGEKCHCYRCSCTKGQLCQNEGHKCCRCGKAGATKIFNKEGQEIEIWTFPVEGIKARREQGMDFIDLINFMSGQVTAVYDVASPMNIRYKWQPVKREVTDKRGRKTTMVTSHKEVAFYTIKAHYKFNNRKNALCGYQISGKEGVAFDKVNEGGSINLPSRPKTIHKNGKKFNVNFQECGNCQYIFQGLMDQLEEVKQVLDKLRCTECGELACVICSYKEKKPFIGKLTCHHCHESFETVRALAKIGSKR